MNGSHLLQMNKTKTEESLVLFFYSQKKRQSGVSCKVASYADAAALFRIVKTQTDLKGLQNNFQKWVNGQQNDKHVSVMLCTLGQNNQTSHTH